ncbi:MAG: hypothetical protein ABL958_09845 [Bdellovibrionia bacterium]
MLVRQIITLSALALVAACTSSSGGGGGGTVTTYCYASPGAACVAAVAVCDASHLAPFAPSGISSRVAVVPPGSYRYIGGDVYAETTNLTPNAKIALSDVEPENAAYPGALMCLTNLGPNVPTFDTTGAVPRNIQRTSSPDEFALTGVRRLSASYNGGTLQTLLFSQNQFQTMTGAQIEALQQQREAQGWSVSVYRPSQTEFKIVIIRTISSGGTSLNLFIASRYSYIP